MLVLAVRQAVHGHVDEHRVRLHVHLKGAMIVGRDAPHDGRGCSSWRRRRRRRRSALSTSASVAAGVLRCCFDDFNNSMLVNERAQLTAHLGAASRVEQVEYERDERGAVSIEHARAKVAIRQPVERDVGGCGSGGGAVWRRRARVAVGGDVATVDDNVAELDAADGAARDVALESAKLGQIAEAAVAGGRHQRRIVASRVDHGGQLVRIATRRHHAAHVLADAERLVGYLRVQVGLTAHEYQVDVLVEQHAVDGRRGHDATLLLL